VKNLQERNQIDGKIVYNHKSCFGFFRKISF
jgi:hypothetical protein